MMEMTPRYHLSDWFDRQAMPSWEKYLLPLADRIDSYVEIGVSEGRSMLWVLEHLKPKKAIGIDPYAPPREMQAEAFRIVHANALHNLGPHFHPNGPLRLFEETSRDFWLRPECYRFCPDNSVDLAYIDGSHWAWDVSLDAHMVWPKLKRPSRRSEQGGIMVCDDLNRWVHNNKPCVRVGIRAFMDAFETRWFRLYEEGRQLALVKRK